jgi:hypothetical protein
LLYDIQMRSTSTVFVLWCLLLVACPSSREESRDDVQQRGAAVRLEQNTANINDPVVIHYSLPEDSNAEQPWIAVVPESVVAKSSKENWNAKVNHFVISPENTKGKVSFRPKQDGKYIVRLFPSMDYEELAVAAEDLVVKPRNTPGAGEIIHDPPFISVDATQEVPDGFFIACGAVVFPTWQLNEPVPSEAWVGLVPQEVALDDPVASHASALFVEEVDGRSENKFRISLPAEGEFSFRIYSSAASDARLICESERFTVFIPGKDTTATGQSPGHRAAD